MTNDEWTVFKITAIHERLTRLEEAIRELRAQLLNLQRAFPR